jgi:hypothetical protein
MDDREAYEFYADPAHREASGPARKRQGQQPRLSGMTSIRFAPEVIEAVKGLAFSEGVTVGSWIRRLVDREIGARARQRPQGLVEGSGVAGDPRALTSTLSRARTFSCPHFSVGNVVSASCETCGPLEAAA